MSFEEKIRCGVLDISDNSKLSKIDHNLPISITNPSQVLDRSAEIKSLLGDVVKHSNQNYAAAVTKAKTDRLAWRKDKVLRAMRPRMSADRYTDICKALARLDGTDLNEAVTRLEMRWA